MSKKENADSMSLAKTHPRKLLVLDSSYSWEAITERGLEHSVTCRDLDGYFDHVWTVHPIATLVTSPEWSDRFGVAQFHRVNERHTFVEGKAERFSVLEKLLPINFAFSQIDLLVRLAALIRRENISCIRAGDPLYQGLLGLILSRMCGIPLVIRVPSNNDKIYETTGAPLQKRLFKSRKVEKIVERLVFANAQLVAASNYDNLAFAQANGVQPENSTIFRHGNLLDVGHFVEPAERRTADPILERLGVEKKQFLICVGRLEQVKRPDQAIHVLARLHAMGHHSMKLLLVGDGHLAESLRAQAKDLGVQNDVVFCGNQTQEWLAQVLPHTALVVSPITGRALTEAALAAVPIVAYDIDWQSEIIKSGNTGELVPYLDIEAMSDAAGRILGDPAYSSAISENVRALALSMVHPQTLNDHERSQYSLVIGQGV